MNLDLLLADAMDKQTKAVQACNDVANRLVAQVHPFMGANAEAILSAEDDFVMSLAMDLVDARTQLKIAHDEYEALKRRAR